MILDSLELLKNNYETLTKLDSKLSSGNDFSSWLNEAKYRAKMLKVLFERNNSIQEAAEEFSERDYVSLDEAKKVLELLKGLCENDIRECPIFMPILYRIIDVFREVNEVDLIVETLTLIVELKDDVADFSPDEDLELISYGNMYKDLNLNSRKSILTEYLMLTSKLYLDNKITLEESYVYFLKFLNLYNEANSSITANKEEYNIAIKIIVGYLNILALTNTITDTKILATFKEIGLKIAEEENFFSYVVKTHLNVLESKLSFIDSIKLQIDYLLSLATQASLNQPQQYALFYGTIEMLAKISFLNDKKQSKDLFQKLITVTYKWDLYKELEPNYNNVLGYFTERSIEFMDDEEEILNLLVEHVLKNQLPTYLHSEMVKDISLLIFKYSYKSNKDLYSTLNMTYEEIIKYITVASLIHDIGKTKITGIINNQNRKLTDYEFNGIINHPVYGSEIISKCESLNKYKDVILFHHKFYNDEGGYPYELDNESSYKIIIDIISIADSLDAATDYIGRTYKEAKKASTVIEELVDDNGIRYNPILVDIIANDINLGKDLIELTESHRAQIMYDAYINGLKK